MFAHPIVVLDFETTGLNVDEGDRVTEVAALRIQDGRIVERYESLVNCECRLSRSITSFTHITQSMIDNAPAPRQVFSELLNFIGDDAVFAHNAAFDQGFLDWECQRAGLTPYPREFFCTVKMAQHLFPDLHSHALGPLACSLNVRSTQTAHRAAVDAEVAARVLLKMTELLCVRQSWPFVHVAMLRSFYKMGLASAA